MNAWLQQQRAEDAAMVEAAQAREHEAAVARAAESRKRGELEERLRRREQMVDDVGKPATNLELVDAHVYAWIELGYPSFDSMSACLHTNGLMFHGVVI